jgi:hypothetical protein
MSGRYSLQRAMHRLGWPGVVGAGFLVLAATVYFTALLPANQQVSRLRAQLEQRSSAIARPDAAVRAADSPAAQLVSFRKAMPDRASLPDCLEKIFAVAERSGINLDEGDYKLLENPGDKLVRIQITFPLKASYPQIRNFIAQLKLAMPAVALAHIQMQRQKVAETNVEAQIRLVLFMEPSA